MSFSIFLERSFLNVSATSFNQLVYERKNKHFEEVEWDMKVRYKSVILDVTLISLVQ